MSLRLSMMMVAMRYGMRPLIGMTPSPRVARRSLDALTRLFCRRAPAVRVEEFELAGRPARRLTPPEPAGEAIVLYFHGGGYVTGSPASHTPMASRLASLAGISVVLPHYRLAPESPFPAAFEDAVAAWSALRSEGYDASRIAIGGDSAGGGLALALLAELLARGEAPLCAFAYSPWTDLTLSGASLSENARRDALLPVRRIEELTEMVLQGADPEDPRISPLFAEFTKAPPVYLQVSDSEILRDDSLRLAEHLKEQSVFVRVDRWKDAPHVWQMLDGWVPEARDALARTAEFLRDRLMLASPKVES